MVEITGAKEAFEAYLEKLGWCPDDTLENAFVEGWLACERAIREYRLFAAEQYRLSCKL